MKRILFLIVLLQSVLSHSNLLFPQPRGNKRWWGFCSKGLGCEGPCEAPKSLSPFLSQYHQKRIYQRGQVLDIKWMRLNHPGGFIRLSLVPFEQSDVAKNFDSNVLQFNCFESNCKESSQSAMLGKLNGPGSTQCSTALTLPNNLKDGNYTLQWTWFGGGVYYADQKAGFANYVSCSDFVVKGGNKFENLSSPYTPKFKGGDALGLNHGCRYWSTNSVHGCVKGAEDGNKKGCGYTGVKFGTPVL